MHPTLTTILTIYCLLFSFSFSDFFKPSLQLETTEKSLSCLEKEPYKYSYSIIVLLFTTFSMQCCTVRIAIAFGCVCVCLERGGVEISALIDERN